MKNRLLLFRNTLLIPLFFLLFTALNTFGQEQTVSTVTVTTDRDDYWPGSWVTITGTGWQAGEEVQIVIKHMVFTSHPDEVFKLTADGDGNIDNHGNYFIDDEELGETFLLTATGMLSGSVATTTFTDSPKLGTLSVSGPTGYICQGTAGSVTYTVTVTPVNPANFDANLCINGSLPSGITYSFTPSILNFKGENSLTSTLTITADNTWNGTGFNFTARAFISTGSCDCSATGSGCDRAEGTGAVADAGTIPMIACPADKTVSTNIVTCDASVGFVANATGNPTPTVTYKIGTTVITSPHTFPKGTTTVTATATNVCGSASCSFSVTVNDDTPPQITNCAQERITEGCDASAVGHPAYSTTETVSSYTLFSDFVNEGAATDNCGITSVKYQDVFDETCPMTVSRKWTLADGAGNTAYCYQTIHIVPPTIYLYAPDNFSVQGYCKTQDEVQTYYDDWLTDVLSGGGCDDLDVTNNAPANAPSKCGGEITVTWTAKSKCQDDVTASATFTVPAIYNPYIIAPDSKNVKSCSQEYIQDKYNEWLAAVEYNGGCNLNVTSNAPADAPSRCGGYVTVTWTGTSDCYENIEESSTFTVLNADPVDLHVPANKTVSSCYSQSYVTDQFNDWMESAGFTGGCSGSLSYSGATLPDHCGDRITVTWRVTSACEETVYETRTFTVNSPDPVQLNIPSSRTVSSCYTQTRVNELFEDFVNAATYGGGCHPSLGVTTSGPPDRCGGSSLVTWRVTSDCEDPVSHSATFYVTDAPDVVLTAPAHKTVASCQTQAEVDAEFTAWLGTVYYRGGCDLHVTNNEAGAPDKCGGSKTVTWTATSSCHDPVTASATFTVAGAPDVVLIPPDNTTVASSQTQAEVDAAFEAWLETVSYDRGCNLNVTNNAPEAGPDKCGGYVTVTWTATSTCQDDVTESATFTVTDAPDVVLTAPADKTTDKCLTQAQVNAAFTAWLGTVSYSGGCNLEVTNNSTGAPDRCGGSVTVTWTATSSCHDPVTDDATFTVPTNAPPTIPADFLDKHSLWPPNHKMVDIVLSADDDCPGLTGVVTVTSNEPVDAIGDGNTDFDWIAGDVTQGIDGKFHIQLRAERSGVQALVTPDIGRIYTVGFTVTDACGNTSAAATNNVYVAHNIVNPVAGKSFPINTSISLAGTFWDVPGNKHTAKWIVDGTTINGTVASEPSGTKLGKVTGSYKPTVAGVYKLRMNVTDQKGITGYATTNGDYEAYFVAYDPTGGYTYGAGSFTSPAGSLTAKPSLSDQVKFGFTSNYYKNATNPKGETVLELKISDGDYSFEFLALNYDYLAVNGAKAVYKGLGKTIINALEQSGFAFIMSVIDGQATNGGGIDKIRLKIYNKNTGAVIYDNQPGASETALPTVAADDPVNSIKVVSTAKSADIADVTGAVVEPAEPAPTDVSSCDVIIPNGFSPNGDAMNDYFQVACIEKYPDAKLQIYSSSGPLLYEKDHYGNLDFWGSVDEALWNGTDKGKNPLDIGTYIYILDLDHGKKGLVKTGFVFISR